jgi:hypothetical protein
MINARSLAPACPTGEIYFPNKRTYVRWLSGRMAFPVVKNILVCSTSKHRSKISLISRVLRCRCVWVGQRFGDFLDLCEKVIFLIQYRVGGLTPHRPSFFYSVIYMIYIYTLFCYSAPGCILYAPTLVATRSCPVATGAHSGCNLFTSGCN